jgi:RND family efflux transporter MFP subunit
VVSVTTNGKVEPVQELEVRARLEGRILEAPEAGAEVKPGGILLRLDAGPVSAELAAARSERLAAEDSLRVAREALVRARRKAEVDSRLLEQGALTAESEAESRAALADARARLAALEREVPLRLHSLDLRIDELSAQQSAALVTAPFAGTVYRADRRKGEMVRPGDPILWLADLTDLRVRANVDQTDLGRVHEGQAVHIRSNAFPERSWNGKVAEVVPRVVEKESRAVAESLVHVEPPTAGLVPGMSVDVEIVVEDLADALQVPSEAIFVSGTRTFVYRIEGGRVRDVPVHLGRSTARAVEVVDGLAAGDRVVLGPVSDLYDGARVSVESGDERR